MPRVCTVCRHATRAAIDAALVAGEALRPLAARFQLSPSAIRRHQLAHLPAMLARAKDAAAVVTADDLLREVVRLHQEVLGVLAQAKAERDGRLMLVAVGRACRTLELQARLFTQLREQVELPQRTEIFEAAWGRPNRPRPGGPLGEPTRPGRFVAVWGTPDGYLGPDDPERPGGPLFDPERHAILEQIRLEGGFNAPPRPNSPEATEGELIVAEKSGSGAGSVPSDAAGSPSDTTTSGNRTGPP